MPTSNGGNGRFTVTLPKSVIAQLDAIADERGTKRAILMREAVFAYLKPADQSRERRAS